MTLTSNHGDLPTVQIQHLAEYTSFTAFGATAAPLVHRVNRYWQKHLKDDHGVYFIVFKLDKPATESVSITWEATGTAVEDTHWSTASSTTLTLRGGNSSVSLPITIIDKGKWFFEKYLTIRVTSVTGAVLGKDFDGAQLIIRPATDPPLVSVGSTGATVGSGVNQIVRLDLSYVPLAGEEPTLYWKATGDLAPAITGLPLSGTVQFQAGTDSRNIAVQHDGTGTVGDSASIIADYESDQVAYSDRLWDTDAQAWVTGDIDVHVDENLWCHSTDIMAAGTEWQPLTTNWPFFPSNPRNTLLGGVDQTDKTIPIGTSEAQDTTDTPVTDPNTGNDLEALTPNANYDDANAIPYLRQSFNLAWGGGPDTGHITRAWSRTVYRIAHWTANESTDRDIELHRVGARVRTQNRDHGVVFRTDVKPGAPSAPVPGTDRNGTTGHTVFTDSSGVKHWYWSKSATHPDDSWGIFEDSSGVGYYFIHKIDSTHDYGSVGNGAEVIGTDTINPVEYPVVYDTTLSANDTAVQMASGKKGTMMHSVEFQQFDTEPAAPDANYTHWPKAGIHWSPRGSAVRNTASPGSHIITSS
jgi:hypothetical protein